MRAAYNPTIFSKTSLREEWVISKWPMFSSCFFSSSLSKSVNIWSDWITICVSLGYLEASSPGDAGFARGSERPEDVFLLQFSQERRHARDGLLEVELAVVSSGVFLKDHVEHQPRTLLQASRCPDALELAFVDDAFVSGGYRCGRTSSLPLASGAS